MPIDTSMYANIQPVQPPNILGNAEAAMKLSQIGMQNAAMQRQFQTQAVVKQAYLDNTDSSGNLDRQGLLSQLGQFNPQVAQDQANALYQGDKTKAEAQTAQAATQSAQTDAQNKLDDYMTPKLQYVASLANQPDQQAAAYDAVKKQFASSGIHQQLQSSGMQAPALPDTLDQDWLNNSLGAMQGRASNINNHNTQAKTAEALANATKLQNETNQTQQMKGADELEKFKDDVVNASSRKTTGSLLSTINSADRITALSQQGAQPNETADQTTARLNKITPQIAQEYASQMANVMSGGIAPEELQKKLAPDTISGNIANLQQRVTAQPTAANQGALIQGYVDAAKQIRAFSQERLGELSDRARAAYPLANKYYPDQMDKIAMPLTAPTVAGQAPQDTATSQNNNSQQYRQAGSGVSADELNKYAISQGPSLAKAYAHLKGLGYVIGQ